MRKFGPTTINTLIKKIIKKYESEEDYKDNTVVSKKNNIEQFLECLNNNNLFKKIYAEKFGYEYACKEDGGFIGDIRSLFMAFIRNLYVANFATENPMDYIWDHKIKPKNCEKIELLEIKGIKPTFNQVDTNSLGYLKNVFNYVIEDRSKFLEDSSIHRIDLLSALDLFCSFFRKDNANDVNSFVEEYTMFMNKVNNSRICAWYSRSLEEVVELYCIYNHLTSNHYEHILYDCKIKGTKIKGLLNYKKEREKEVCQEDCVKELTATEELRTNILEKGITETTVQGFVEYMEGQIRENPYNFSQLRYKTLISSALKELDKTIEIEDEKFNGTRYFSIDEWCEFIKERGLIELDEPSSRRKHSRVFCEFLYCCTKGIVEKTSNVNPGYKIRKSAENVFTYETELLILRSLIMIKCYNEYDKAIFLKETNEKLKELNLFQIYSVKEELLKGFAIDYAVTNDL